MANSKRAAPEAVTPRDYAEIDVLAYFLSVPQHHRVVALELIRMRDLLAALRRHRADLPPEVVELLERRIPDPPTPEAWRELLRTGHVPAAPLTADLFER